MRCLVVDDDSRWQEVLGQELSEYGFECSFARSDTEAIRAIREAERSSNFFKLIVLDRQLEGMGDRAGTRVLSFLKRHLRKYNQTVCVVISGTSSGNDVRDYFKQYLVHDFISKNDPCIWEKLKEISMDLSSMDSHPIQDSQNREGREAMDLSPDVKTQAIAFLFDIGRWAASELKERWTLLRQKKQAGETVEISLSNRQDELECETEILLQGLVREYGIDEIQRAFQLIEHRRKVIHDWKRAKLDQEEEYLRQNISRTALRLVHEELDQKISDALGEIETDFRTLGVEIKREKVT